MLKQAFRVCLKNLNFREEAIGEALQMRVQESRLQEDVYNLRIEGSS